LKKANIFDIIVIALIVCAAAAGIWYVKKPGGGGGAPCRVVWTVEWTWAEEDFANAVKDAASRQDIIKDSVKGYYLGKAYNVEVKPDKVINFDAAGGRFIETESPGRFSVYLSVIGNGVETADELRCEGQAVRVGQKMSAKGKGYAQTGYITEVYALPPEDAR
jgi:hypothetical protein